MKKINALAAIATSVIISVMLAMAGIEFGAIELGALYYLIMPAIAGLITLLLFLALDYLQPANRKNLVVFFIFVNLLVGVFMRLNFYYNFLSF